MKAKHVDEVVVKMSPDERDALVVEIQRLIAVYDGGTPYPLALHDFGEELKT